MDAQQTPEPNAEAPIQSASATTDHEANKSGSFAYGLTALVLGILILFTASLGSCVGSVAEELAWDYYYYNGSDYYDYGSDYDDDWLDWLGEDYAGGSNSAVTSIDQADAAALLSSVCSENLNDYVSALDYSGASSSVRSYVKNLCTVDANACADVTSLLSTAQGALDSGDTEQAARDLAAAATRAQQAAGAAQDLAKPDDCDGSHGEAIEDCLDEASGYVSQRWLAVADAIQEAASSEHLTSDFDEDAEDATDDLFSDGANLLLDALALSGQHD